MIHLLLFWACVFFSCLVPALILCPPPGLPAFLVFCASASTLIGLSPFFFLPNKSSPFLTCLFYFGFFCLFVKSGWTKLLHSLKSISETSGALDLGGASTQITFVPNELSSESPENLLYFRLYGKDYIVYTHSFLCYGKDQALQQKLAKDLQASTSVMAGTDPWPSPLWHTGAVELLCSS